MPDPKKIKQAGQARQDLTESLLERFAEQVRRLQEWLYDEFYNDFVGKVVDQGRIKRGGGAISKITGSPVWRRFYRRSVDLARWIVGQTESVTGLTGEYFRAMDFPEALTDAQKASVDILTRLGYDGGQLVRGGFLDTLINDVSAERRIKRMAVQAINAGKSLKDFQAEIKDIIKGDLAAGRLGVVEAHYRTNANTLFAEFDRQLNLNLADKYKLTHAVWTGPRLKTSRGFCNARKGKVFSREQLQAMDNLKWEGKIPGQSTLISAGGYNCVDLLLWVTEEAAEGMQGK